jgi:hypothetical protein
MRLYPCFLLAALFAAALTSCRPTYPPPATPREGTLVNASFGRTWEATIDAFADRGISTETLDRSSGLIVPAGRTFTPRRDLKESLTYADCGKTSMKRVVEPLTVKYNVVVRGDSSHATVIVRAFYRGDDPAAVCSSKGPFESEAEAAIKTRAESR